MLLNRNRSELHFFSSYERLICSEELGNRHQTPTLIGCMLLTIRAVQSTFPSSFLPSPLRSAKPSIMTDFLKLCPAVFAVSFCDSPLSPRLAVVISEALDSIPTFDRPEKPRHLFPRCRLHRFLRRCCQRSPRL